MALKTAGSSGDYETTGFWKVKEEPANKGHIYVIYCIGDMRPDGLKSEKWGNTDAWDLEIRRFPSLAELRNDEPDMHEKLCLRGGALLNNLVEQDLEKGDYAAFTLFHGTSQKGNYIVPKPVGDEVLEIVGNLIEDKYQPARKAFESKARNTSSDKDNEAPDTDNTDDEEFDLDTLLGD